MRGSMVAPRLQAHCLILVGDEVLQRTAPKHSPLWTGVMRLTRYRIAGRLTLSQLIL